MLKIRSNHQPINNFTIYAERHSGTNFLEQYIPSIYYENPSKKSDLPITWEYGFKHWFGFFDEAIAKSKNTLFIGIVRNPYNWLAATYSVPHHFRRWGHEFLRDNDNIPFTSFKDFLLSEVESYYNGEELKEGCEFGNDHHITENRRYKNIFELRETKYNYLLNRMPKIAKNYILINYEILHEDIKKFVSSLNDNFNLTFKDFINNDIEKPPYPIDESDMEIINKNLNWTLEMNLNYKIGQT